MNKSILNFSKNILPKVIEYRRHLHNNPELSFNEFKTVEYIRNILSNLQIEYTALSDTGTIAFIKGSGEKIQPKRWIALRADIDALPINEQTGLPFSSKHNGVMHACGHDMHTAMLLGAAEILNEFAKYLNGNVKLIFQPGEEKLPGGANLMIDNGCLINPEVEAIFGQHVYPERKVGEISVSPGAIMGSADEIYIKVNGKSTHAAQPHIGNDAVLAAAQLIVYLQSIITKTRNPIEAGVLSITSIKGGTATNIFPENVEIMGTLRTFDEKWRNYVHTKLIEDSKSICSLYGCTCDVNIIKGYPPVINSRITTDIVRETAIELLGTESVTEFEPKMWGEDFAFYLQKVPGTFWFLGVRPDELKEMPPLHNSKFSPNEQAMIYGMSLMTAVAIRYFEIN